MSASEREIELALVLAVGSGRTEAIEAFLDRASAPIWSAILLLGGESAEAKADFAATMEALAADSFAKLTEFDGRASLGSFLALIARQIVFDGALNAVRADPQRGWRKLERVFARDIRRRISRRFPRSQPADREDIFQDVCLHLTEDRCRRVRAFAGRGRFEFYLLTLVERILIDIMRKEAPRRRLPAAIERLPALQQAVFTAVAWDGAPPEAGRLFDALKARFAGISQADVEAALETVQEPAQRVKADRAPIHVSMDDSQVCPGDLADHQSGVEEQIAAREAEAQREAFLDAIRAESQEMAPDERLFLTLMLAGTEPVPKREIAAQMGLPVTEVQRIQARVLRRLRKLAQNSPALSVSKSREE